MTIFCLSILLCPKREDYIVHDIHHAVRQSCTSACHHTYIFFPLLRVFSPWLYMKEQEFTSIEPFKVIDSIDFLALTTAKFCHSMVIGLYHYD